MLRRFNTQPPEGGWGQFWGGAFPICEFQHTAARRRLDHFTASEIFGSCFNTQPPEGGWRTWPKMQKSLGSFQHTAARRRLVSIMVQAPLLVRVSTHSRPKAAGKQQFCFCVQRLVSTHSRPKAAGPNEYTNAGREIAFQHTAARRRLGVSAPPVPPPNRCFNTQPPEGGWSPLNSNKPNAKQFQHTAARRRLGVVARLRLLEHEVSTHSRPKAAGYFMSSAVGCA